MAAEEQTIILVKAAPQASSRYGETVCCAGITREGRWRRLFPIRFRHLGGPQQFSPWDVVAYRARPPKDDRRAESRRVEEDSLRIVGAIPLAERPGFFSPLIRSSLAEAAAAGESLTLIRPTDLRFRASAKKPAELLEDEKRAAKAVAQGSLLDQPLEAMTVCPYNLRVRFVDAGGPHEMECADWETTTAYWRFSRQSGEAHALEHLRKTYEEEYVERGIVLALGTVAARPRQWLLLGVIRLDETAQLRLL